MNYTEITLRRIDKLESKSATDKVKIKVSIGTKIIGMTAFLLVASVISLVYTSSQLFVKDNTALIQQMNADTANNLALQVRETFNNLNEKLLVISTYLYSGQKSESQDKVFHELFNADQDLVGVELIQVSNGIPKTISHLFSPEYKTISTITPQTNEFSFSLLGSGEVQITTSKLSDDTPVLFYGIPLAQGNDGKFNYVAVSAIKLNKIFKLFASSDLVTSYLINQKGKLIAHPENDRAIAGESFANLDIVKKMLEGKFNNGQTKYIDPQSNLSKLGAYKIVGLAGMGVVSEVLEDKAFAAARVVIKRSILIALIILSISFFLGFMNSRTITKPILSLVDASKKIAEGNFKINLTVNGGDEISHLSNSFNEMAIGLEERDRVKETFNKFHSKEIAEKLLSGEVKLGGERRKAIIFFSDVRGFTGMSEKMQPEEVVEMLNEYMTSMVSIITKNNGIVDKYVGDAIMALWGVPLSKPNDYHDAIKACIEMRIALNDLNNVRISRGQTPLKIGMGLNTGEVIAGNIGSNEKMEYTVIGDSVNLASRIESMTKEYGTDLLISNYLYEYVKDQYIFEECEKMKVKGKVEAISVFKVNGYIDQNGNQVEVQTPYSSYEAEKSDKVVHDKKTESINEQVSEILTQWYIKDGENEYGPFTTDELIEGITGHEISEHMLVASNLDGPWLKILDTLEFGEIVKQVA